MDYDLALGLLKSMLWNAALIAGPVLLVTLVVGLLISVIQVATQLQEMTLSYVPKLIASGAVLILLGPWMLHNLTSFAVSIISMIPDMGR